MFGWLKRTRRKRKRLPADRLRAAVPEILSAYAALNTKHPSAMIDASWLPVDKEQMVEVFKIAWLRAKTAEARNSIERGWLFLPFFQAGVGGTPIDMRIPTDASPNEIVAAIHRLTPWEDLTVAEFQVRRREIHEFRKANSN
jgi:hypothetical protein